MNSVQSSGLGVVLCALLPVYEVSFQGYRSLYEVYGVLYLLVLA